MAFSLRAWRPARVHTALRPPLSSLPPPRSCPHPIPPAPRSTLSRALSAQTSTPLSAPTPSGRSRLPHGGRRRFWLPPALQASADSGLVRRWQRVRRGEAGGGGVDRRPRPASSPAAAPSLRCRRGDVSGQNLRHHHRCRRCNRRRPHCRTAWAVAAVVVIVVTLVIIVVTAVAIIAIVALPLPRPQPSLPPRVPRPRYYPTPGSDGATAATPRSGPGGRIPHGSGGGSGRIPGPSPARSDAAQTLASLIGLKRTHDDARPDRGEG